MNEINWRSVAEEYKLTPSEIEEQIFIAACTMADMAFDNNNAGATAMQFTCAQPNYKLELTVRRIVDIKRV